MGGSLRRDAPSSLSPHQLGAHGNHREDDEEGRTPSHRGCARANHDHYYGSADTSPLFALADARQLQAWRAIVVDVREGKRSAWLDGVDVPQHPLH
jgi:hypothetical protein